MKKSVRFSATLFAIFVILGAAGCTICPDQTPTYIEGTYYRTLPPDDNTFDFVQFASNGAFTYVNITPDVPGMTTARDVYDGIAERWLEPYNVAGHTGNYVIIEGRLYVNYMVHESMPEMSLSGNYSEGLVIINGPGGEAWNYLPLP